MTGHLYSGSIGIPSIRSHGYISCHVVVALTYWVKVGARWLWHCRKKKNCQVDCTTDKEVLAEFMHHTRALVGETKTSQKQVQKEVIRILIQALAAYFNLNHEDFKKEYLEARDRLTFEQALKK
eukprot:snap_masked-scaffold_13-processed-gene-11.23-mRNA-1 protein AED:1.00 eAED:1.00 QI:0/0/0/0/1/1/2/0/123